jgi:hypothetical protein
MAYIFHSHPSPKNSARNSFYASGEDIERRKIINNAV